MANTTNQNNSYAAAIAGKVQALETSKEYLDAERAARSIAERIRDISYNYDRASAANDAGRLADLRREYVLASVAYALAINLQAALFRSAGFAHKGADLEPIRRKAALWGLADLVPADLR